MNKYLDAAGIALSAIWAAKLRSLMTVLGNIVAVTSIIAVVSLIQGLNASVKSAILNQAGADSFIIQQYRHHRSDEEFDKVRINPRITPATLRAIRRNSELAASVMADASSNGRITYRERSIDQTRVQGVTEEYVNFSSYDAERGRLMSPTEVQTSRPVAVIGWRDGRPSVRTRYRSARQDHPDRGRCISVSSASARSVERCWASRRTSSRSFRSASFSSCSARARDCPMSVKPRDVSQMSPATDEAMMALRSARRLKPRQPDNFGIFTSDTILGIYRSGHERHLRGARRSRRRCRSSSAAS